MKNLLLVTLLAFAGCTANGKISADAIDSSVTAVCDRHDAYVSDDPRLSDADKATFLRSSALLKKVVAEAKASETSPPVTPAPAGK